MPSITIKRRLDDDEFDMAKFSNEAQKREWELITHKDKHNHMPLFFGSIFLVLVLSSCEFLNS